MIRGKLTLYLSIVDGIQPQKRSVHDAVNTINTKKENILFVGFSGAFQEEIKEESPQVCQDKFFLGRLDKKKETLHLLFSPSTKAVVFNHIFDAHHQKDRLKLIRQLLNAGIDVFVSVSLKYFALCNQELKDSFNINTNNFLIPDSFFKRISRIILVNNFDDAVHESIDCPIKEFLILHPEKNTQARLANMAFILATHINYNSRPLPSSGKKTSYTHLNSVRFTSFFKRFTQLSDKTSYLFSNLKIKTFDIAYSILNIIIAFFGTQFIVTSDVDYHKVLIVFLTCAITLNLINYGLFPTILSILFGIGLNLHTPDFSNASPNALIQKIGLFIGLFLVYILIQNKRIVFQQLQELSKKESHFNLLYTYMETLSTATNIEEVFSISEKYFRSTFNIDIILILQNPYTLKTKRIITPISNMNIEDSSDDSTIKQLSVDQYKDYEFTHLISDSVELGWLGMQKTHAKHPLNQALMGSSILQITIALQRYNLSQSYQSAVLSSEKEQLRSIILSSISHDLKTPLTTIIGSCTALEELENLSNKNKMILVHAIHEASNQLNQFISNILDSSRLASENILQQNSLVYLDDVVNVILHRSKKILRLFDVAVTVTNSEEAVVYGDFTLIQQVFYNIIENATKYIPIGGKISIFITNIMDKVFVKISDDGPGIIASKRKLIFDKFYRFQHSDQQKAGTGLGLSICKQIIEAYNGRIWVADRDDGKEGAQFNIELPCAFSNQASKVYKPGL